MELDFDALIASAQAEVEARAAREADLLGISVEDLYARQEREAADEEAARLHSLACEERAERLRDISPGLTAETLTALTQGALPDSPRYPALTHVRRWLRDPNSKPMIVLAGGTGVGKTVACAWALATMGGEYVRAIDLAQRHTPYRGECEKLHIAAHTLMILDDLGTEQLDRRFMPALYDLVDQRQGAIRRGTRWVKRRTIITTNAGMDAFRDPKRYGEERIRSRLRQNAVWVSLQGEDQRKGES